MYKLIRPILFSLDPERAHDLTMSSLGLAGNSGLAGRLMPARVEDPLELLGLQFPNRVGLSAGLDKNGTAIRGMASLGFGFLEVGTVTPKPQAGNPKPRMFRLVEQQAIINRMGFNNGGVNDASQSYLGNTPSEDINQDITLGTIESYYHVSTSMRTTTPHSRKILYPSEFGKLFI